MCWWRPAGSWPRSPWPTGPLSRKAGARVRAGDGSSPGSCLAPTPLWLTCSANWCQARCGTSPLPPADGEPMRCPGYSRTSSLTFPIPAGLHSPSRFRSAPSVLFRSGCSTGKRSSSRCKKQRSGNRGQRSGNRSTTSCGKLVLDPARKYMKAGASSMSRFVRYGWEPLSRIRGRINPAGRSRLYRLRKNSSGRLGASGHDRGTGGPSGSGSRAYKAHRMSGALAPEGCISELLGQSKVFSQPVQP